MRLLRRRSSGGEPGGRRSRRLRLPVVAVVVVVLVAGNGPVVAQFVSNKIHQYEVSRPAYEAKYGYWQTLELPPGVRVNAVHTALLQTGKLLIIAGSGNSQQYFEAGTFKTLLWDPVTGKAKLIPTPSDMFCGGHAFLPDGKLLVAGGTARYEQLPNAVKNAGGPMRLENDSLTNPRTLAKETVFVSAGGQFYKSDIAITVPPRAGSRSPGGRFKLIPGQSEVWVDALNSGRAGLAYGGATYHIAGPQGSDYESLHAVGRAMSLAKEEFQGTNAAYLFNPYTERYEFVPPMPHKRWYPTVATLAQRQPVGSVGPQRRRAGGAGRNGPLQRQDAEVERRPLPLLPHLSGALPHRERQAVLHRFEHRLRPRHQGSPAGSVGCAARHLPACLGATRSPGRRDQRLGPASARAGAEGDDPRWWRRRGINSW